MFTKKALFAALIAAGTLGAVATPAAAESNFGFQFNFGATPVRHYDYQRHYQYQPSRWDRDGDGIPNRRDPTPDGFGPRWDRDNDGIPNRRDPTPDGVLPFRGDRDGDGVPNRYDDYPRNPYWR